MNKIIIKSESEDSMKEIKNFVYKTEGIYLDRIECCNYDCRAIIITKMTLKKFVELYVREHTHTPFYGVRVVSIEQGTNWYRVNQYLKDQDPFGYDYDSSTYKTYSPKLIISLYKDKIDTEEKDIKLYSYPLYIPENGNVFKDTKFMTEKHTDEFISIIDAKITLLKEEGNESYLKGVPYNKIRNEVRLLNQLRFIESVKLMGVNLTDYDPILKWFLDEKNMAAAIVTSHQVVERFQDENKLFNKYVYSIHCGSISADSEHWEKFSVNSLNWEVTE